MELEPVPSAPLPLAESCIELLSGKAMARGLDLIAHLDPTLPSSVLVDGGRLRQILLNLLDNAIKFTEAGTVALRIALLERANGMCRIGFEVIDSGIGISPQVMPTLFQPFTQADASVTRRYGGTGLGLSICKRLLDMMGSAISVDSGLGRGSTFRFDLWLRETGAPAPAPALPPTPVLIMTTHARQAAMLVDCLRHWGMQPVPAASLEEARKLLGAMSAADSPPGQPPLAVLDDALPAADALAQSLLEARDDLRLLLLTRNGKAQENAAGANVHALLPMPLRQEALLDALRFALERRQLQLPVLRERRAEAIAPDAGGRRPILLVEDNPTNRKLALYQLERIGLAAHVAENGEEALAALQARDYALVLMDCQMPVMDGFETTRRIRDSERGTGRRLPIIAMTANAMEGDRERCLAAGMDDYLPKPVRSDALAAMLRRHLPPAQEATPVLDCARLEELFGDDVDMRRSLLRGFCDGTLPMLRQLGSALAEGRSEEADRIAHQLLGSSANLGAREMATLTKSLRQALRESDLAAARQRHALLEAAWQRFADYLEKEAY
jgi:CheY-like chemotaxis protein/HPt (histidine-containing phosphotransfer) domain-containing protein